MVTKAPLNKDTHAANNEGEGKWLLYGRDGYQSQKDHKKVG